MKKKVEVKSKKLNTLALIILSLFLLFSIFFLLQENNQEKLIQSLKDIKSIFTKKEALLQSQEPLNSLKEFTKYPIYTRDMSMRLAFIAPSWFSSPSMPITVTFSYKFDENGIPCNPTTQVCQFSREYTIFDDGLNDDGLAGDKEFAMHLLVDDTFEFGTYDIESRPCADGSCGFSRPGPAKRDVELIPKVSGECKNLVTGELVDSFDDQNNRELNIIAMPINIGMSTFLSRLDMHIDPDQSNGLSEHDAFFNIAPINDNLDVINVLYVDNAYFGARSVLDGEDSIRFFYKQMVARCPTQLGFWVMFDSQIRRASSSGFVYMHTTTRRNSLTHELGHVFGGLGDEYVESLGCSDNKKLPSANPLGETNTRNLYRASTVTNNRDACRENAGWSYLTDSCVSKNDDRTVYHESCPFSDMRVSCFHGANNCDSSAYFWRPADRSLMWINMNPTSVDVTGFCKKIDLITGVRRGVCSELCIDGCPKGYQCIDSCPPGNVCITNPDGSICTSEPCPDDDSDGICNDIDNCPLPGEQNPDQADLDNDGIGDVCDSDADSDGFNSIVFGGSDCDDLVPNVFPGASEICGDGIDQDCSGSDLLCPEDCIDLDGDGFGENCPLGLDCDDNTLDDILPENLETCPDNSIDCTSLTSVCAICINSNAPEVCDGIDNNCALGIDESLSRNCAGSRVGECAVGTESCIGGSWQGCPLPSIEDLSNPDPLVCSDGLDNDCDGISDFCSCSVDSASWSQATVTEGSSVSQVFTISDCSEPPPIGPSTNSFEVILFQKGLTEPLTEGLGTIVIPFYGFSSMSVEPGIHCDDSILACTSAQFYFGVSILLRDDFTNSDDLTIIWECDSDGDLYLENNAINCDFDYLINSFPNTQFDCDDTDPNIFPGQGCAVQCSPTNGGVEICDNIDNDCDGSIDNQAGNPLTQSTSCGLGVCQNTGIEACISGVWQGDTCAPLPPQTEICDGLDNDCDGSLSLNEFVYSTGTETGLECSDGLDNDCDIETDWDTQVWSGGAPFPFVNGIHGDNNCPIQVILSLVSNPSPIENEVVTLTCTSNQPRVNSIFAYIDENSNNQYDPVSDILCNDPSWFGDQVSFNCEVGLQGIKQIGCSIDTTLSYQSGSDSLVTITVTSPITDSDSDGIPDSVDNCPFDPNPLQEDCDEDEIGDICDPDNSGGSCIPAPGIDTDNDGIEDDGDLSGTAGDTPCTNGNTILCDDNCPINSNPLQEDSDSDLQGDACDICPLDPDNDQDSDGICGDTDNCPLMPNFFQDNQDSDLLGDLCDSCPQDPNNDADSNGICENDEPADTNNDNQINIQDLTEIIQAFITQDLSRDVTGDGRIDIFDLIFIAKRL